MTHLSEFNVKQLDQWLTDGTLDHVSIGRAATSPREFYATIKPHGRNSVTMRHVASPTLALYDAMNALHLSGLPTHCSHPPLPGLETPLPGLETR